MRIILFIGCMALLVKSDLIRAQKMVMNLEGSDIRNYSLKEIRKIKFSDDSMHIFMRQGEQINWAKKEIVTMYFEDTEPTLISSILGNDLGIKISPIPNDGNFQLEWPGIKYESALIEITDLQGRIVYREIHETKYSGNQSRKISLNDHIKMGCYVVKLTSGSRLLYSKIMVQK
jgi:hypothetical protein